MKRIIIFLSCILLTAFLCYAQVPAQKDAEKALEAIKKLYPQWSQLEFHFDRIDPSPIPDYYQAKFFVTHQDKSIPVAIYFRKDNKYVFVGQFIDAEASKSLTRQYTGDVTYAMVDISQLDLKDAIHIGNLTAPVKIIEYSDFQCPFCKKAAPVMKKIMQDYPDKVVFVYKHIPWPKHEFSQQLARGAECARQQKVDAFWKFHDYYFSDNFSVVDDKSLNAALNAIAKKSGLAMNKFNDCYKNKKTEATVMADFNEAKSIGISSTPTFIINGQRILGALSYEDFKKVIDSKLKDINQPDTQVKNNQKK